MVEIIAQLGIAGALLAVFYKLGETVLKNFIKKIDEKDREISSMVSNFNTTMNNHIDHETKSREKEMEVLNKLCCAIERLSIIEDKPVKIKKIRKR